MGAVTIDRFGGIVPRLSPRLLPDNAAQVAANCRITTGELVPIKAGRKIAESEKGGPLVSIFRIVDGSQEAWLAWGVDVDVVRAPLLGNPKWCLTGDGEPRITSFSDATQGAGNNYPAVAYTLGIPKPTTKPTVSVSGGIGVNVDRMYAYTFYASWDGLVMEGAVSPISNLVTGKIDGTWQITGMDAEPPNGGAVTGSYASGRTTFTGSVPHFLRAGEQVVISGSVLTVEAVPSATSFQVSGDFSAASFWSRKAPFPGTIYKRLYRTTGTGGQFQLVADGITGTSYTDTLTDSQIPGDALISASWEMPPVNLRGLIVLPSGALCGFSGNEVCFSEPYQPHAWPVEYRMRSQYDIVGVAHFGSGLVAATTAKPFIITGVDPGQMSGDTRDETLPCLSKRSVVSLGDVVLYSSVQGLIAVNSGGAAVWTQPYFTVTEWAQYAPETMAAAVAGRKLYVFYRKNTTRWLTFDLADPQPYLTEMHVASDAIYSDLLNGKLYYSSGSSIYEHDSEPVLSLDWQSKDIVLPMPRNLGAAKVVFEHAIDPAQAAELQAKINGIVANNTTLLATGNVHGSWNAKGYNREGWNGSDIEHPPLIPPANEVAFSLYTDGKLRFSKTVKDSRPFRLPSGYKSSLVSVRVQGQCVIRAIEIGETILDLRQTGQQ